MRRIRFDAVHGGWMGRLALGIVLLYVAVLAFRVLRILSPGLALAVGTVAALVAVYHLAGVARIALRKLFRDPYSLDALRELEQRAQNQPEEVDPNEMAGVYCPSCDEVYVEEVRYCPRCGRSL